MLDFLRISTRSTKRGVVEIYPRFIVGKSNDLMIRGGDFYAVWDEKAGRWSTDEDDVLQMIDDCLDEEYLKADKKKREDEKVKVLHVRDSENRIIAAWHRFCKDDMQDNYKELDNKIIFANDKVKKKDYESRKIDEMELVAFEKYDYVIIACRTDLDYDILTDKLGIKGMKAPIKDSKGKKVRTIKARAVWYEEVEDKLWGGKTE